MRKLFTSLLVLLFSLVCKAQTYFVMPVAGTYGAAGFTGNGGPATAALMGAPWDVCTDTAGNVYVLDQIYAGIRKINTSGIINIYGGTGVAGYTGNGGPATAARFTTSSGNIATDRQGNLYICEHWNNTIRKIDPSGIVSHVAGVSGSFGYSGDGGPATSALIYLPSRIITDHSGNIYFMDAGNRRVRKIDASGVITTVAGNGGTTPSPNGLPATATTIDAWSSLAVDKDDNLYIGLTDQKRIIKINSSGIANGFAGSTASHPGPGPLLERGAIGPAIDASFFYIGDIEGDDLGNIFIYDGAMICKVDTNGIIKRIGGQASIAGHSGNGSFALNAYFRNSYGIDVATNGDIYFAEELGQTVRKLIFVNHPPTFTNGSLATLASCTSGTTFSLDSILSVHDLDSTDTLNWSVLTPPANGTLMGSYSSMTNRGIVTPTGLFYTASPGYVGVDSFTVEVYDGLERDTITVRTTIVDPTSGISGLVLCEGQTSTLTYSAYGGTWLSDNASVAIIDSVTGVIIPVSLGTTNITYQLSPGCYTSAVVTVNVAVSGITSPLAVCSGTTSTLIASPSGGTWQSLDSSIASITPDGDLTAIGYPYYFIESLEVSLIYTAPSGCSSEVILTINTTPSITGNTTICQNSWDYLSSTFTSGYWTSSDTSIITIDGSGNIYSQNSGMSIISFTSVVGCVDTMAITSFAAPTVTGTMSLCQGDSTTLVATPIGGIWNSTDPSVATISSIGQFNAIYNPMYYGWYDQVSYCSYTSLEGCIAYFDLTVNATPEITGTSSTCADGSVFLSTTTTTDGLWESSDTSVAYIYYGGYIIGLNAGTSTITYTSLAGCGNTYVVTVYPNPVLTVPNNMCAGSTYTLTSTTSPGYWTSFYPYIADFTSTNVLSAISTGSAFLYYVDDNGCSAFSTPTVYEPSSIYGHPVVCSNDSIMLYSYDYGGLWTTTDTLIATVDSITGYIYPASAGVANISYTNASSCVSSIEVTVLAAPANITNPNQLCLFATDTFGGAHTGVPGTGLWSSSDTTVLLVDPTSGAYNAVSIGTATISFVNSNGCIVTKEFSVDSTAPFPGAIGGSFAVTVGGTTTLTSTVPGGTWSSADPSIATVSSSGVVTGIAVGVSNITYTYTNHCGTSFVYKEVEVSAPAPAITGTLTACQGSTTTLSSTEPGGLWSSGDGSIATINPYTGVTTGISAGTATISYTVTSGTYTAVVTINPLPAAITGPSDVCLGSNTTYTSATTGGGWASSDNTVALIDHSSGMVMALSLGTATLTYSLPTGCFVTHTITVHPMPSAIAGTMSACEGSTSALTSSPAGGTWSSASPGRASVSSAGIVTAITAGTTDITYTSAAGCMVKRTFTVLPAPAAITGDNTLCIGESTLVTTTTTGGSWSSLYPAVATIDVDGTVTALTTGTTLISYTATSGCTTTFALTVSAAPAAITGASAVCIGASTVLTSGTGGGTWSVDASGNATVGTSGIVTGIAAGAATISYTLSTGCFTTAVVTVHELPAAITGSAALCAGSTATYTSASAGGTWSINIPSIATVSTTGLLTATAAGNPTITYTLATGCRTTLPITINGLPSALTGDNNVCEGNTTTYTCSPAGGAWASSNTSIATISTSGVVTGIASGTATITYTLPSGCFGTKVVTVIPTPVSFTGTRSTCIGSTTTLSSTPTGGTWSSSNTAIATVAAGVVTGVTTGTVTISYTIAGGCRTTAVVSVFATPSAITGVATVCQGSTTTLASAPSGGAWTSANTAIATISSAGVVSGIAAGTATISYTAAGSTCSATRIVTVHATPGAISGPATICAGTNATLTATPTGGTWSSSNTAAGTINTTTGIIRGIATGTTTITYRVATGCISTRVVTVSATPDTIIGSRTLCPGSSITMSGLPAGGTWSSSSTAVATINTATGLAAGVSNGTTIITYTTGGSCIRTTVVTVNSTFITTPAVVNICAGASTTLPAPTTASGAWSSTNTTRATINATTGLLTGVGTGTAQISYTVSGSCRYLTTANVTSTPAVLYGTDVICAGKTASWISTASGGAWSSSNTAIATINAASGLVTGIAPGTATITYTITGCIRTRPVTINASPAAIVGPATLRRSTSTTFTNPTPSGTWSSSNALIAAINATTGLAVGVNFGPVTISYTLPNGCFATKALTITVTRPLASNDETTSASMRLYPNPTVGTLNLEVSEPGHFYIYTIDGKEVGSYPITELRQSMQMPAMLAAGMYMGKFVGNSGYTETAQIVYYP